MFSANRQKPSPELNLPLPLSTQSNTQSAEVKNASDQFNCLDENLSKSGRPNRKTQSATARLEKSEGLERDKKTVFQQSSNDCQQTIDKVPSVINLHTTNIPDCEEENLIRMSAVRVNAIKNREKCLMQTAFRPSSAKSVGTCPVSKQDEPSKTIDGTDLIKPSVYGFRMGRKVFGADGSVLETWKQSEQDFPFKLSSQTNEDRADDCMVEYKK